MGAGVSNIQKTGNENVDKTVRKMAVLGALRASANENKVVQSTAESKHTKEDIYEFVRRQKVSRQESTAALEQEAHETPRRTSVLPDNIDEDAEDEKTVEELYKVPSEDEDDLINNVCGICNTSTILRIDGWPCRVCGRAYHRGCILSSGRYTDRDLELFDRAKTPVGWSCEKCDNILNLLPQEELDQLSAAFEEFDINRDSSVSVEEYLAFKRRQWFEEEGYQMPREEEEFERTQFRILDADGNGDIDYWEFAKKEACKCLARMPKDDLVALLSPLEKLAAKRVYDYLDDDQNGFITEDEARAAFTMWYSFLDCKTQKTGTDYSQPTTGMVKPTMSAASERHASHQANLMLDGDEDGDRTLTWKEFLKTQAIYILCARSNKTRLR